MFRSASLEKRTDCKTYLCGSCVRLHTYKMMQSITGKTYTGQLASEPRFKPGTPSTLDHDIQ
jgi:hypothetical protein